MKSGNKQLNIAHKGLLKMIMQADNDSSPRCRLGALVPPRVRLGSGAVCDLMH